MKTLRNTLLAGWQLLSRTLEDFSRTRSDLLAAALAFHTLLSMAPLIIVAVAIAGLVLGQGAAHAEVSRVLNESLGPNGAATVNGWVQQASEGGKVASLVGIGLMLLAASRFGATLKNALNQVYGIDVYSAEGFKSTIKDYLRRRLFAFALAAAAGPLLLVVFLSRTLLTGFHTRLFASFGWQGVLIQISQLLLSLVIVSCTSAVVFRYVPDTRICWKHALVGGVLTSILFNIGNALVSLYLARATVTAAYGAAGSVVVVLLWLYFSAEMFLLGAQFTRVYSELFGHGLSPREARELEQVQARRAALVERPHDHPVEQSPLSEHF
jgi:membrane protein